MKPVLSKKLSLILLALIFFIGMSVIKSDRCQGLDPKDFSLKETGETLPRITKVNASDSEKSNRWEGVWVFTVLEKDLRFYQGNADPSTRKAARIVYSGFLVMSKSQGLTYEYLPESKTRVIFLDFNQKGNQISWGWKLTSQSKNTLMQTYKSTIATYDPSQDKLFGKSDMVVEFSSLDQLRINPVKLPGVSYEWSASRISEADFAKIIKEQATPPNPSKPAEKKLIEV